MSQAIDFPGTEIELGSRVKFKPSAALKRAMSYTSFESSLEETFNWLSNSALEVVAVSKRFGSHHRHPGDIFNGVAKMGSSSHYIIMTVADDSGRRADVRVGLLALAA